MKLIYIGWGGKRPLSFPLAGYMWWLGGATNNELKTAVFLPAICLHVGCGGVTNDDLETAVSLPVGWLLN